MYAAARAPQPTLTDPDPQPVQDEVSNTIQVEAEIEVVPTDEENTATIVTPQEQDEFGTETVTQPLPRDDDIRPNLIKLDLDTDYEVCFPLDEGSTTITVRSVETIRGRRLISYKLSLHTSKVCLSGSCNRFKYTNIEARDAWSSAP